MDDDGDDDDKTSGDQHALMAVKQQPRLGTSSKVDLVAATLNFSFRQSDELNSHKPFTASSFIIRVPQHYDACIHEGTEQN